MHGLQGTGIPCVHDRGVYPTTQDTTRMEEDANKRRNVRKRRNKYENKERGDGEGRIRARKRKIPIKDYLALKSQLECSPVDISAEIVGDIKIVLHFPLIYR